MAYDTRHDEEISDSHKNELRDIEQQYYDDEFNKIVEANQQSPQQVAANKILGRERAAAAGKLPTQTNGVANPKSSITRGGLGVPSEKPAESTIQRGGLGGTRRSLGDRENDSLYRPSEEPGNKKSKWSVGNLFNSKKFMRRRLALAAILSALVGGGGGFAAFAIISGPFQILQLGHSLEGFHLTEKEDQSNARVIKGIMTLKHLVNGEYERTRMGFIGNYFADSLEAKLTEKGYTASYVGGRFAGYVIDPSKLSSADHPDLKSRDPQEVAKYMEEKYGAKVTVNGGNILVEASGSYFKDKQLFRTVLKTTGLKWTSPLSVRAAGIRMNFGFHWMRVLSGQTLDEKYRAWVKEQFDKIKRGTKVNTPNAQKKDKDGKDVEVKEEDAKTVEEIRKASEEAGNEAGDPTKTGGEAKAKLQNLLRSKMLKASGGFLAFLCIIQTLSDAIDGINMVNSILPMSRMGMQAVSMAGQIEDDNDVDTRQMGWYSSLLYSKKNGNSWSDARSIQAEFGRAQSGPDIPEGARVGDNSNLISRMTSTSTWESVVKPICKVAGGTLGFIITAATLIVAPFSTLIQGAALAIGQEILLAALTNIFANDVVNPLAEGADRGNFMNYGVRLAANDVSLSRGGLPLTPGDEALIAQATKDSIQQDFNNQDLAYRLFNPEDPKSFVAQIIQSQTPDPAQNASNMAIGMLNIGKTFGTTLGSMLAKPASAAAGTNYDYGFPDYAFSPSEMNSDQLANPFENAEIVANILDANANVPATRLLPDVEPNPANYISRAKACFGVDITRTPVVVGEGAQQRTIQQYGIAAPSGSEPPPTMKTITDTSATGMQCLDGSNYANDGKGVINDWTRVRMFIFDSQVWNAIGCLEGTEDDEVSKQACVDIGLDSNNNGGTAWDNSTGVPTCNTTAISAAPPGYKLTSCDDFEGTSLDGSTFTAYNGGGGNTVSGRGRVASQCTVANSFLTLTQGPDGATCGTTSNFNQKEGYWEVRMRTAAIDGGDSTAHPVLILWPGSDRWADGELDYFETDIGKDGGGFLHCVGNPSANCLVIPGNSGNKDITPTSEDYKSKSPKSYYNWHSYGLMWKPDSMTGYIDGQQWWTSSDGSFRPSVPMHQTIQLDNLSGDGSPNPAQMQADWVHVYAPN